MDTIIKILGWPGTVALFVIMAISFAIFILIILRSGSFGRTEIDEQAKRKSRGAANEQFLPIALLVIGGILVLCWYFGFRLSHVGIITDPVTFVTKIP